jgi:hypothetical protein
MQDRLGSLNDIAVHENLTADFATDTASKAQAKDRSWAWKMPALTPFRPPLSQCARGCGDKAILEIGRSSAKGGTSG